MRILTFLRGVSGTGKSTWIEDNHLKPYTISPDELRLQLAGVKYNTELDGFGISQDRDKEVWRLVKESVEFRMRQGQTIYLDATFKNLKSMQPFIDLCKKYFYKWTCKDFGTEPVCDNSDRGIKSVPESVVERQKELYEEVIPEIKYEDRFDTAVPTIPAYKNIYFIGDIHGCYEPLYKFLSSVDVHDHNNGFVFIGDYLDRGPDNLKTFDLIYSLVNNSNVHLVMGNHEVHWVDYLTGNKKYLSTTFGRETLPELLKEYPEKELKKMFKDILNKTRDCFLFNNPYSAFPFLDEILLVSHAGVDVNTYYHLNNHFLINLPSSVVWKGVRGYDFLPYKGYEFSPHESTKLEFQIHGHRNNKPKLDIYYSTTGITGVCLESKVESGGKLSVLNIGQKGIKDLSIDSPRVNNTEASSSFIESLEEEIRHKRVKKKTYGHIDSYIFDRKVFYKGLWNNVNSKARGLFINNQTNNIVARGYDKFFNFGEELAPSPESLAYPVTVYAKENGFLGILSWDEHTKDLFISSKSSPTSDFSQMFKEILFTDCSEAAVKEFMNTSGLGYTLVFEVIDPIRDPHVIKYDTPKVVLLDMIENSENFKLAKESLLKQAAKVLGCEIKKRVTTFKTPDELTKFIEAKMQYTFDVTEVNNYDKTEGYVIRDIHNKMAKIKLPFYKDVRYLREEFKRAEKTKEFDIERVRHDCPIACELMSLGYEEFCKLEGRNLVEKVYNFIGDFE